MLKVPLLMEEAAGYKEEKDSWETNYWSENNEVTNTPRLCTQCGQLHREP